VGTRSGLQFLRFIELPEHRAPGGFDHAAIHRASNLLYVAHTVNDALDVINCAWGRFLHSVGGLGGVAGVLVSQERYLVFTSSRGENTVGVFSAGNEPELAKIPVGVRPNGLAFDPQRGLLLAANIGSPDIHDSFTLSIVDIRHREMIHSISVPGRTCWTVFDPHADVFYVNIADPAQIAVVEVTHPDRVARLLTVPGAGPHGLDLDAERRVLFCACDVGKVFAIAPSSGEILHSADLSGAPDVIFFNKARKHLYVAVGDPGVIEVFDTETLTRLEVISTEKGAHTLAFDPWRNKVYAFLPQSYRAQVFADV
jgi:DNA-binding beta-propeller fold protein YncE